jgi:hypothetical protein
MGEIIMLMLGGKKALKEYNEHTEAIKARTEAMRAEAHEMHEQILARFDSLIERVGND